MARKHKSRTDVKSTRSRSADLSVPEQSRAETASDGSASPDIVTLVRLAVQETVTIHHTDPLPPPETLLEYEQALPGLADRIVAMAERQASHRQNIEIEEQRSKHRLQKVGQACGIAIVLASLLLVYLEKPGAAAIAIVALAALAGVFVFSKYHSSAKHVGKLPSPDSANVPEP